jgi:hypothetical protein
VATARCEELRAIAQRVADALPAEAIEEAPVFLDVHGRRGLAENQELRW